MPPNHVWQMFHYNNVKWGKCGGSLKTFCSHNWRSYSFIHKCIFSLSKPPSGSFQPNKTTALENRVSFEWTYGYQRHKVRCRRPLCRCAHPRGRPRHPAAQLCGHIACTAPHELVRVLVSSPEATSSSAATLNNNAGKVIMIWQDLIV